jgi:tetratricopeptide (TPR) repeat protein
MEETRGMLEQYEEIRNDIRRCIADKESCDYKEAINGLFEYLDLIQIYDDKFIKDDYWFVYYNLGLVYKKIEDVDNSLKYIKLSINNCDDTYNYIKSKWLLNRVYENILEDGNNELLKEFIDNYKVCSDYFKKVNNFGQRISIMFNVSKLKKDKKNMMLMIKIFDKKICNDIRNDYFNSEYGINYILIREMCQELVELYKKENNLIGAMSVYKYILHKDLKSELKSYISNLL